MSLPPVAEPFLMVMSIAFIEPSFQRSLGLTVGDILIKRPRTVLRVLSTLGPLAPGHHTDSQRLFSRAPGPPGSWASPSPGSSSIWFRRASWS